MKSEGGKAEMKFLLIVLVAKFISFVSRRLNLGAGGTWPGEIALLLDKQIFEKLAKDIQNKIILVCGTNGKTTTAKMIDEILLDRQSPSIRRGEGRSKVLRNESGANVLNGLVSTLLINASLSGKIKTGWIIFEVDEATLPIVLGKITPQIVVLLNLFRDQLDRYGEIDIIADKWLKILKNLPKESTVILNADDPQIAYLGKDLKAKVLYFGLSNKEFNLGQLPHATDSIYCPSCQTKLAYKTVYLSHLGRWFCKKCNSGRPELDIQENGWKFPLLGVYNRYNTLAAILTGKTLGISSKDINNALKNFQPSFGRQEEFLINGRKIKILLSKNPTGMNEAIRTVIEEQEKKEKKEKQEKQERKGLLLLVLNDRIPDGRDVSWIWDADTEELVNNFETIIVSGDRAYDMGLRIKYSDKFKVKSSTHSTSSELMLSEVETSKFKVIENLKEAIHWGIEKTGKGEIFYILPTYSAMLEVRKILTGRKIL